ncbi:MAG: hypothetical protein ACXVRP_13080 [Solirubrobacteraceae bacterium]
MLVPLIVAFIVLIGIAGLAAVAEMSRPEPTFGSPALDFDPIRAITPSGRQGYAGALAVIIGCGLAITRVMGVW